MRRLLEVYLLFIAAAAFVLLAVLRAEPEIMPYTVRIAPPLESSAEGEAPEPSEGSPSSDEEPLSVNINTATAEELEALPGIGPAIAERIVTYREEHGGFYDVTELTEVSGIGEKTLQNLLPYVFCE